MMRERVFWMVALVGVAAGSAWWTSRSTSALEEKLDRLLAADEQSAGSEAAPGKCVVSVDSRVVHASVRSAVAAACKGLAATTAAPAVDEPPVFAAAEPEQDKLGPTPEMIQSYDAANELVEAALTAQTWTPEDVEKLRPLMMALDDDSREEITLRVVRSLNEGKLEFTGRPGELF